MSTEENKALVRRYIEEFVNTDDLSRADEFIAPEYRSRAKGVIGPAGYQQLVQRYHTAFPDFHITIDDIITDGDVVAMHMTWRGTHQGEYTVLGFRVPPTGKPVTFQATGFRRIANGKLVEGWGTVDRLSLLQQLGAIPSPESTNS